MIVKNSDPEKSGKYGNVMKEEIKDDVMMQNVITQFSTCIFFFLMK